MLAVLAHMCAHRVWTPQAHNAQQRNSSSIGSHPNKGSRTVHRGTCANSCCVVRSAITSTHSNSIAFHTQRYQHIFRQGVGSAQLDYIVAWCLET